MIRLFMLLNSLLCAMDDGHKEGLSFVKSKIEDVRKKAVSTNPAQVPGFKTSSPKESSMTESSIGELSVKEARKNPVSSYISEHAKARKKYHIDPLTDPMILSAKKAIKDPHKSMNEIVIEENKSDEVSDLVTCEEGGESYTKTCTRHLVISLKITPEVIKKWRYCPGHAGWDYDETAKGEGQRYWRTWHCKGCQIGQKMTQKKCVEIEKEEWENDCHILEDNADKGLCHYVLKSDGPKETRIIQGEPVTRDHWTETLTYECFKKTEDNCASLRARGCIQVDSKCSEMIGDACVSYLQTYQCQKPIIKGRTYKVIGEKSPFCLTGDCVNSDFVANTEMFQSMAHLSFLKQAQDDSRKWNCIFKGEDRFCTKNCIGFRDCCRTGKGWGISLGLSACSADEKELGSLRDQKRCVLIGTYCAEKVLKQCIRKKTVFCCFGTKLSRLIQEQGRRQLKIGWGEPEAPECRGFSPEELSRLDLSKMNLSELYEDIRKNFKPKDKTEINLDRLKENMTNMTRG